MITVVCICVAWWFGLNAALVARRVYVTRGVKSTLGSGHVIWAAADFARHSRRRA
jgi:hypothetical protein